MSTERRQPKRPLLRIALFIGGGTEASTRPLTDRELLANYEKKEEEEEMER